MLWPAEYGAEVLPLALDAVPNRAADIAGIPKKATQDSIGITENTLGILEGFQKK